MPRRKRSFRRYPWFESKYRAVVKQLRRYASGFDTADGYDLRNIEKLTTARKRRIRKYGNRLIKMSYSQRVLYRPRKKANLKVAQESTGMPKGYGSFKVAFVPVGQYGVPAKIEVRRHKAKRAVKAIGRKIGDIVTKMTAQQPKATFKYYRFDQKQFVDKTEEQIRKAFLELTSKGYRALENKGATMFTISSTGVTLYETDDEELLVDRVAMYMNDYGPSNVMQWLFGIRGEIMKKPDKDLKKPTRSLLTSFREWR